MRLREKEITDRGEIEELLKSKNVCHFGMCDGAFPYVLPTTYGYADGHLYIHSSKRGRKIEVLKGNNRVCFTVDTGHELVQGPLETSCKSTIRFKSVVGDFKYSEEGLRDMAIIRVDIESITGKKNGY